MYCFFCCTSLVELITLYGWLVALHENYVVIQCIPYIKTCHMMYTKIFHALTGSNTTSSSARFGKKSCWKMFIQDPLLLDGVGRDSPFETVE